MTRLAQIIRHPIKSIGVEELQSAPLSQGRVLPFDRHWAVAHKAAKFEGQPDGWHSKMNFLRGVAAPQLMAITAQLDEASQRLTLSHPKAGQITLHPGEDEAALLTWLRPLWPENRPDPSHVVQVPGQAMTDVAPPYLAILNHGSLRALSSAMGQDLSIHRFRGNLWVDAWDEFFEFELIGRHLRIGTAELKIEKRITRCAATKANPATGTIDGDTLAALNAGWGHQDFGVYARVVTSGQVTLNDKIEVL